MRSLSPNRDNVPHEISAIRVRGQAVLYYQLPDLDWLLLFATPAGDALKKARNVMVAADGETMNRILKGEIGSLDWVWPYVGLRDDIILMCVPNPEADPGALSLEEARAASKAEFGDQADAPTLSRDPRTGELREVARAEPEPEPEPEPDEQLSGPGPATEAVMAAEPDLTESPEPVTEG